MNCTSTDHCPTRSIDCSAVVQENKNDDFDELSSEFTLNGI